MGWSALKNVVLENNIVTLRRICLSDRTEFARIAFEPEMWQYFTTVIATGKDLDVFIEEAIRDNLLGTRAVFAIVERKTGRIAGSTAYGNLVEKERKLEIGWSWLGREFRGTGVNRAVKFLLMEHAFETLLCERVEFKTDVLNLRARRGLEAVGAVAEGVLRSFNYMPGGRRRDAIYYSVLRREWPAIRDDWRARSERKAMVVA
jgi:RimJ/RimL family protein N-acetyltransferase